MTAYRCASCGNPTRFDVMSRTATRAFHHFILLGEVRVEDETVLERPIAPATSRCCGHGASVEAIDRDERELSFR
ncbi:MAG TPA: hypothetical protein VMQ40_05985 [Acidimicrobiales bacterium]|nr:hypothetical protein [Acidimicrobiales bacterium]